MSSEESELKNNYRSVLDSAPKLQRQRIKDVFGLIDRLKQAGIDIGDGYRLEHPLTRKEGQRRPEVRIRAQNQKVD